MLLEESKDILTTVVHVLRRVEMAYIVDRVWPLCGHCKFWSHQHSGTSHLHIDLSSCFRYGKIISTKAIIDQTTNKCKGECSVLRSLSKDLLIKDSYVTAESN